jgi:hypothetical protein
MTELMRTALIDFIVQLHTRGCITEWQLCAQLKHLHANSAEQPAATMYEMLIEFRNMVSVATADNSNSNPHSDAYNSCGEDNRYSTSNSSSSSNSSNSSGVSAAQSDRAVVSSNSNDRQPIVQQQQQQQQQQMMMTPTTSRSHADRYNSSKQSSYYSPEAGGSSKRPKVIHAPGMSPDCNRR